MLEIVIYIVLAIVAICAIKIAFSFKFDYVAWRKMRDEKAKLRLKNLCPHASVEIKNASGDPYIESTFVSPFGRIDYICKSCGISGYSEEDAKRSIEYWTKNTGEFIKA